MSIIKSIFGTIRDAIEAVVDLFDGDEPNQQEIEEKLQEVYITAENEAKEKEGRELTQEEDNELVAVMGAALTDKIAEKADKLKEKHKDNEFVQKAVAHAEEVIEYKQPSTDIEPPEQPRKYYLNRKARRFAKTMGWPETETANGLIAPDQDVHPKVYSFINTLMNDRKLTKQKKREIFKKFFKL